MPPTAVGFEVVVVRDSIDGQDWGEKKNDLAKMIVKNDVLGSFFLGLEEKLSWGSQGLGVLGCCKGNLCSVICIYLLCSCSGQ